MDTKTLFMAVLVAGMIGGFALNNSLFREVAGLDDTIENLENDNGNGFKFYGLSKDNLTLAIKRAFDFYSNKDSMQLARQNAIGSQYSWDEPAQSYRQLYYSSN